MADLAQQIKTLEDALDDLPAGSPARAGLEAMLAPLRAAQARQTGGASLAGAQIERIEHVIAGDEVGGDKVLGNKHIYLGGQPTDGSSESALKTFLSGQIAAASHLTLPEADNADPSQSEVLLEDVFTRLEVTSTAGEPRVPEPSNGADGMREAALRQLTALEVIGLHPTLVLLGAPGGGKSTLTRFLTLCLGRAWLNPSDQARWLAPLGEGWSLGLLLPIRVELGAFADWLRTGDSGQGAETLLWEYLAAKAPSLPGLAPLLRERLLAGEALLLLDGLDEVAADTEGLPLRRVRDAIAALAELPDRRRLVVTCRILDYEERQRQLVGWPVERLLPFSDALQQEFIDRWYQTLRRLGREVIGDYDDLRVRLRQAIREKRDLRRLAGNPLLLTMMALLHASKGRLPEKRVDLYAESLDLLLRRWRRAPGRPSLEEQLGLPQWDTRDTDHLLNHLAYAIHQQHGEALADEETAGGADLPQALLIETTTRVLRSYGVAEPYAQAERLCTYISLYSNGVLQMHGPTTYRFPHRTFQEYLAARRLIDDRDWDGDERDRLARLRAKAGSAQWREVLLLAVSLLVAQGQARTVADLCTDLLRQSRQGTKAWAANALIVGEILVEAERKSLDGVRRADLWAQTTAALRRCMGSTAAGPSLKDVLRGQWKGKPLLEVPDRVRAGTILGRMEDPRLVSEGGLEPDWCEVPAGPFLLDSKPGEKEAFTDEQPQRTVVLPPFRIARHPVTNAQWRLFIDAGGYREPRWWSAAGWALLQQGGRTTPRFWDDPRFNGSYQPVVGVTWYEATAYCRWLTAQLRDVLPPGHEIRLPSEAEWEKAARGTDGRAYPWGNNWDGARANTRESGIGQTTPIGCFPEGASPYGVQDMAGNVLEWTATPWSNDYSTSDGTTVERYGREPGTPASEGAEEQYVSRGGAWGFDLRNARCACRNGGRPSNLNFLGLRVVAALTDDDI